MPRQKRQLTAYGRWIKTSLVDKDMTLCELAESSGVELQYISKLMRGYFPGMKYRVHIEKALGATPPADLDQVS